MIAYKLALHRSARADLEAIWIQDPRSAGVLQATLEQIAADPRLLDSLTVQDFGAHQAEIIHVARWAEQQRLDRNLWRFKLWEIEGWGRRYRVVYALDPRFSRYFVLGIFTRDFNYDPSDPRTRRVIAVYDELGIPRYR